MGEVNGEDNNDFLIDRGEEMPEGEADGLPALDLRYFEEEFEELRDDESFHEQLSLTGKMDKHWLENGYVRESIRDMFEGVRDRAGYTSLDELYLGLHSQNAYFHDRLAREAKSVNGRFGRALVECITHPGVYQSVVEDRPPKGN